ncbi:MAG: hypothetical protein ACREVX_01350 [Clostridium sp.]|uniref:hypothetical protein n=1 Tax=Clostridium sp. TaxID=1506 RepID=UPI003D6CD720
MDANNNLIIGKFISKEVENIYSRYKSISEEEISTIRKFIERIEENTLDFDTYLNYNATKAEAEVTESLEDMDLLRCYLFLRSNVSLDISVDDAIKSYASLNDEGYCKIKGYYLYKDEEIMKDLAREELDAKLEDAYEVTSMFDIEEIADMWIFGTSKEETAKQYLRDNDWWDVLECEESERGYIDSYGERTYYAYNSGEE